MGSVSSTSTRRTTRPCGPVCGVTSGRPSMAAACFSASAGGARRHRRGLLRRRGPLAPRDGHAVTGENLLGLVLVNLHRARTPRGCCSGSCGGRMSLLPPRRNTEYMEPAERNQEPAPALAAALAQLAAGRHLDRRQARAAMEVILRGEAGDAHIAALLAALRTKGETVEEIVGFAEALRAHARPLFAANGRPAGRLVDTSCTR